MRDITKTEMGKMLVRGRFSSTVKFNVWSCFVILVDERHPQNHGLMVGGKSVFICNESISVCVCHLSG
jgi:hypothetical protein